MLRPPLWLSIGMHATNPRRRVLGPIRLRYDRRTTAVRLGTIAITMRSGVVSVSVPADARPTVNQLREPSTWQLHACPLRTVHSQSQAL